MPSPTTIGVSCGPAWEKFEAALEDFERASRPIIASDDVRRSVRPYGHEIRLNARLAIREQIEWSESDAARLAGRQ